MSRTTRPFARRLIGAGMMFCVVAVLHRVSMADNPIVQTNYTADPAPMLYGDRLYVHTTHDEDVTVNDFFTMNDWRVYSTVDMANWTDHGSPLSYKSFSWGTGDAWAGQCIPRNGKFYFYVPLNNSTGTKIGVAVSDSPTGPFADALGKPLLTGSGYIDPTVYIDSDEQAYLYWGNPKLYYVKLNQNMTSFPGSATQVTLTAASFGTRTNPTSDRPAAYEEGPWFYKRGSLYYMIYPADSTPEKISYSTGSGPTGPWTFRGDIMAKQSGAGSSFTNHPGIVDFKGKSYFFYHNGALPGGGGYKRSVCVEEFTYGADGSIPTIKMTTTGPEPVATLNPFQQVEAETIAFSSGLKTEVCTDTGGGMNVTSISNGDYIKVRSVDFLDGVTSFDARVSSSGSNAKIELHLDSQTGTLLGTCDVSGASSWTTKTCTVSGGSGKHDLFLKFTGGSGDLFKLNWWRFSGPTVPNPDAGAGGGGGGPGSGGGGAGGSGPAQGSGGIGGGGKGGVTSAGGSAGAATAGRGGAAGSGAGAANGGQSSVVGGAVGGSGVQVGGFIGAAGGGTAARTGGTTVGSGGSGPGGRLAGAGGSGASGVGSGGVVGSGGKGPGGSGGANASNGGAEGSGQSGGTTGNTTGETDADSGCSCRLGRSHRDMGSAALLLLTGALLRRRRR
jgi:arabinoxylan arabinofuranohydrolase